MPAVTFSPTHEVSDRSRREETKSPLGSLLVESPHNGYEGQKVFLVGSVLNRTRLQSHNAIIAQWIGYANLVIQHQMALVDGKDTAL